MEAFGARPMDSTKACLDEVEESDREKWAEAESLAREALALDEKVARQELIASDCHRLAQALLKQNKNLDETLSPPRRAVEIFTRLRVPDDLQSAQETLAEIERAMQKGE